MKLTETQHELLSLIAEHTMHEGGCTDGKITRYWVPGDRWAAMHCEVLGRDVHLGGGGQAQCLISMYEKGWLAKPNRQSPGHIYAITEEGRCALESHREVTGFYIRPR